MFFFVCVWKTVDDFFLCVPFFVLFISCMIFRFPSPVDSVVHLKGIFREICFCAFLCDPHFMYLFVIIRSVTVQLPRQTL